MPSSLYLLLSALGAVYASPAANNYPTHASGIKWGACATPYNSTLPITCGGLAVPLDYASGSKQTLNLQMVRIAATKKPSKGSILINFGGPGSSGRQDFAVLGPLLSEISGGHYDMINFVPRGTGETLAFKCYPDSLTQTIDGGYYPIVAGTSSDVANGENWGNSQMFAAQCQSQNQTSAELVGTSYVARDMMEIVNALNEDGFLRYWGFSYGTLLGATVAAMFPKKMDKLILDGVVNPYEYWQGREVQMYEDTDLVFFDGFVTGCIKNPKQCPLGRGLNAAALESKLYSFLNNLKYNPIVIPGNSVLDYTTLKSILVSSFYDPTTWPKIAQVFHDLMNGNTASWIAYITALASGGEESDGESLYAIRCSDYKARFSNLKNVVPILNARRQKSKIGGDVSDGPAMRCYNWPWKAKERYTGDFNVKTKNPVLVIGNTYDPVTPYDSARVLSTALQGSTLLRHNGFGHTSFRQASLCTFQVARNYFDQGKLPKKGSVCQPDAKLYSGENDWDNLAKQIK